MYSVPLHDNLLVTLLVVHINFLVYLAGIVDYGYLLFEVVNKIVCIALNTGLDDRNEVVFLKIMDN